MGITSILRDTPNNVSLVRMISTDNMATIVGSNYILNQMTNIMALNSGSWQWYVTDMIMCSASDGNALYTFTNSTFSTLQEYSSGSSGIVEPGTIDQLAYYELNGNTVSGLNLIAGTGITTVFSMGNLTISATNNFSWNNIAGTTQLAVPNNGYIVSNASQTTITLPSTIAQGQLISVAGKGTGGWILQAGVGQTIHFGNESSTSGGTLTSTNQWDAITILCITANTTFSVIYSIGNLIYA